MMRFRRLVYRDRLKHQRKDTYRERVVSAKWDVKYHKEELAKAKAALAKLRKEKRK